MTVLVQARVDEARNQNLYSDQKIQKAAQTRSAAALFSAERWRVERCFAWFVIVVDWLLDTNVVCIVIKRFAY